MTKPKIRVMLVDDHEVVRTGLKSFLSSQSEIDVVAEADNGHAALALADQLQPDVVVMDISMPEMDGLEATRRLKATCPGCKVLALTVHSDKRYFFEMLRAGAMSYLTKQAAAEELVEAIRTVACGQVYLQPTLASWLLDDYRNLIEKETSSGAFTKDEEIVNLEVLSKREQQVLELVSHGLTNVQIGETLGISPKTVARHRERIMNKLDLHSTAELVKFAIRSGLISA